MSSPLELVFGEILLRLYPEPMVWFFALLLICLVALAWWRNPASVAVQLMFIVVFTMNSYFGGFFNILNMLMMFSAGTVLFIGIRRFAHKGENG